MSENPPPFDAALRAPASETEPAPSTGWQQQDPVLRDLWLQNKTPQQISDVLGRSIPAIMTRAARLGLPRRTAPGRKPGAATTRRLTIPQGEPDTQVQETRRLAPQQARYVEPPKVSQEAIRVCLMCLRQFSSEGRHNRICMPCKGTSEYSRASSLSEVHLPHV